MFRSVASLGLSFFFRASLGLHFLITCIEWSQRRTSENAAFQGPKSGRGSGRFEGPLQTFVMPRMVFSSYPTYGYSDLSNSISKSSPPIPIGMIIRNATPLFSSLTKSVPFFLFQINIRSFLHPHARIGIVELDSRLTGKSTLESKRLKSYLTTSFPTIWPASTKETFIESLLFTIIATVASSETDWSTRFPVKKYQSVKRP